jgi:xanthine dehydrogenase YagR molybdenum-binding subunit
MREGDWLIGLGCTSACHPALMAPATTRIHLTSNGEARVKTAAHDVGTGAYTVIAQIAAQKLGLALSQVSVFLGDSNLPPSPVSGGSITTASVCNAVAIACDKIRARLSPSPASETLGAAFARFGISAIEEYAEFIPRGSAPEALQKLYEGRSEIVGAPWMQKILCSPSVQNLLKSAFTRAPRNPGATNYRGICRRAYRQPPHRPQPVHGRHDLGHQFCLA